MAAPSLAILDALQTLLQGAFDAAPSRVGASMTVLTRALSATDAVLFPVCRLFLAGEYLEVLSGVSRSNDYNGTRLDMYGFRMEYKPVTASGLSLADVETQMYADAWVVQNTLTASENGKLGGLVNQLGERVETRYARGLVGTSDGKYSTDAGSILQVAEGRFTVRKLLYNRNAETNA